MASTSFRFFSYPRIAGNWLIESQILIAAVAMFGGVFMIPASAAVISPMVTQIDAFGVIKNGNTYLLDEFSDGVAPPSTEAIFPGGGTPQRFSFGGWDEANGFAVMDSDYGRPQIRSQQTSGGQTIFADDLVSEHNFRFLTSRSSDLDTGLRSDDTFTVDALFNLTEPTNNTTNYGVGLSDFQAGIGNDVLRLSVLKSTASGNNVISFFRFENSTGPIGVVTPIESVAVDFNHDAILLRLSRDDTSNNNIRASFAYVDNGVTGSFTSFTNETSIFSGEDWTRAEVRQLHRVDELNLVKMVTGSDVSISQEIVTSSNPFILSFNYLFGELVGVDLPELTVSLGSTVLGTITATDPINPNFATASVLIDDAALLGQTLNLEFLLSGPTGSSIFLHGILAQGSDLENGTFSNELSSWTPSELGTVTALEIRRVPEPGSLALLALGLAGVGWSQKKQKQAA